MAITAADVKKLRDQTGAGMMDAKKALTEADGDFEKATELLRIAGVAKVATRSDREASNGIVVADGKTIVQLGAETDFVAKNEDFICLAQNIVAAIEAAEADNLDSALALTLDDATTVAEAVSGLSARIGEKIQLVNVTRFTGQTHTYLHRRSPDLPPQVGVLVEYEGVKDEALVHSVALQIASMRPSFVKSEDVPAQTIEDERRIAEATAREEGKPEHVIERIIENRVKDYFKESCLRDQSAIGDDKATVGKLLDQAGVVVTRFVRFSAGG